MSPHSGEKRTVRLNIHNQTYTLVVSGDVSELEAAATMVDDLMHSIAKTRNLDTQKTAVYAALQLAHQVRNLEAQLSELRDLIGRRTRKIEDLLDSVES